MPSNLVDLRCDRRLLDHEFEGYKLNLQALPQYNFDLVSSVDRLYPDEAQYSFVHAKLFALHNHFIIDNWDHRFSYYYIDKEKQIRNVTFENINNTFHSSIVYEIPVVERKPGHFNVGLIFPSSNLAIVSDGAGYLHILNTGPRNGTAHESTWKTIHSSLALGENKYFTIVDTKTQENNDVEILHCLLRSIEQTDQQFNSILSWITFENDGIEWKQSALRQIQGKGIVHYCALETSCTALYVASDNIFKVTHDSEKAIVDKLKDEPRRISYSWLQTSDDITITLKLQGNFNKSLLVVNVAPLSIKISYAGKEYVSGKLRHHIDSELTTWNVQENGQVDVLLTKSDTLLWDELIEGGDRNGEQIMDASFVEEVHKRLAHLCSENEAPNDQSLTGFNAAELEECDAASEEDTVLTRIDITKHEVTHRVPLSVHQFLFHIKLETHQVPALALRHDVDACIWQPYAQLVNSETWPIKHIGTLLAFGYIQSSKQNRKFTTCAPNFAYSVVCEASRHIFIYQHANNQDCQLRKRTGGAMKTIKIGQQHVVNIDKYGEVLGIEATNEYLFILTEKTLLVIGIH